MKQKPIIPNLNSTEINWIGITSSLALMTLRQTRILKELAMLQEAKLQGIFVNFENANLGTVAAEITGPEGSRFECTTNSLELKLTEAFPFEPPSARFTSAVRHPNVDEASGRICLDLLKMPPDGSWRPNISLSTVLISIQVLLGCPNLQDVVRPELISEFSLNVSSSSALVAPEKENVISASSSEKKRPIGLSLSLSGKKSKVQENKGDSI